MLQEITIYHKENQQWIRYPKVASVRNTSVLNRNKTGLNNTDNALIRIFDASNFGFGWKCNKGDIIVAKNVEDKIIQAPLTELKAKYGKEYVFEVASIDIFNFQDEDLEELNHIKIGCR